MIVSRSSMTSVALLELLFEHVWQCRLYFLPGDAEMSDIAEFGREPHEARLVIGDAALLLGSPGAVPCPYAHVYDLGAEWKRWTGLPFVFAVWVARRDRVHAESLGVHAALLLACDSEAPAVVATQTASTTATSTAAPKATARAVHTSAMVKTVRAAVPKAKGSARA